MTRVYQAVIRDSADHLGPRLRRSFLSWLGVVDEGGFELDLVVNGAHVRLRDNDLCGRYIADPPDRLKTTITWARTAKDRRNWATITVDCPQDCDPELASAPAFVPDFLAASRASDGTTPLEPHAHEIDVTNVEELLGWLTNPARRVPVVVLTPDLRRSEATIENAARLAEALAGVAVIARLRDHAAQEKLNTALGEGLQVFGGGLRTYLPDLRPGEETYPHRHQVRSGSALRDHGPRALDVVISGVTREAVRRAFPDDIKTATRSITAILSGKASPDTLLTAPVGFARTSLRDQLMALPIPVPTDPRRPAAEPITPAEPVVEPEPPVEPVLEAAPEPPGVGPVNLGAFADQLAARVAEELRGEIMAALEMASGHTTDTGSETVRSIQKMTAHMQALTRELDQTRLSQQNAASLQAEAEDQTDALENEITQLRQDHDQLELDYEDLAADERRARERVRWLEGRLAALSEPVYGVATPEEIWEPESLMDVLLRARADLTRLDLPTRLDADAAKLDVTHPRHCRVWAGKAWDALRALNAYATAAGQFNGGFFRWCTQPPPGQPSITMHMVTMKESETVTSNGDFRAMRTFPVPATVDPSGEVFMEAHIKLQRVGYPAPRMYFHDDAGGPTAKIWIGYLGNHLSNTRTN